MAFDISALNPKQQEVVAFWQGYNVPGEWRLGATDERGETEVFMKGDGFEWSILIEPNGEMATQERRDGGEWETGIEI